MNNLKLAIIAAALGLAVQMQASIVFELNYSDPSGNVANGLITADPISGNMYQAVGGFLNVTGGILSPGTYALKTGGPGAFSSPSGAFVVDNVLYDPANPFLDFNGLLFTLGSTEVNLWGNAAGSYSFYGWTPSDGYAPQYDGEATSSITVVPEPTTMIAGALLLLPFGASTLRVLRRKA